MLDNQRIKEAESNVSRYLQENLLKKHTNNTAKQMYVENSDSSLQTAQKLLEDYEDMQEDALELMAHKVDTLLQSIDYEREKRSKFQYQMDEQAKRGKAVTSLERAKEFVFEMKKLL